MELASFNSKCSTANFHLLTGPNTGGNKRQIISSKAATKCKKIRASQDVNDEALDAELLALVESLKSKKNIFSDSSVSPFNNEEINQTVNTDVFQGSKSLLNVSQQFLKDIKGFSSTPEMLKSPQSKDLDKILLSIKKEFSGSVSTKYRLNYQNDLIQKAHHAVRNESLVKTTSKLNENWMTKNEKDDLKNSSPQLSFLSTSSQNNDLDCPRSSLLSTFENDTVSGKNGAPFGSDVMYPNLSLIEKEKHLDLNLNKSSNVLKAVEKTKFDAYVNKIFNVQQTKSSVFSPKSKDLDQIDQLSIKSEFSSKGSVSSTYSFKDQNYLIQEKHEVRKSLVINSDLSNPLAKGHKDAADDDDDIQILMESKEDSNGVLFIDITEDICTSDSLAKKQETFDENPVSSDQKSTIKNKSEKECSAQLNTTQSNNLLTSPKKTNENKNLMSNFANKIEKEYLQFVNKIAFVDENESPLLLKNIKDILNEPDEKGERENIKDTLSEPDEKGEINCPGITQIYNSKIAGDKYINQYFKHPFPSGIVSYNSKQRNINKSYTRNYSISCKLSLKEVESHLKLNEIHESGTRFYDAVRLEKYAVSKSEVECYRRILGDALSHKLPSNCFKSSDQNNNGLKHNKYENENLNNQITVQDELYSNSDSSDIYPNYVRYCPSTEIEDICDSPVSNISSSRNENLKPSRFLAYNEMTYDPLINDTVFNGENMSSSPSDLDKKINKETDSKLPPQHACETASVNNFKLNETVKSNSTNSSDYLNLSNQETISTNYRFKDKNHLIQKAHHEVRNESLVKTTSKLNENWMTKNEKDDLKNSSPQLSFLSTSSQNNDLDCPSSTVLSTFENDTVSGKNGAPFGSDVMYPNLSLIEKEKHLDLNLNKSSNDLKAVEKSKFDEYVNKIFNVQHTKSSVLSPKSKDLALSIKSDFSSKESNFYNPLAKGHIDAADDDDDIQILMDSKEDSKGVLLSNTVSSSVVDRACDSSKNNCPELHNNIVNFESNTLPSYFTTLNTNFETNALKTQCETKETSNVGDIPVTELSNILKFARNLSLHTSYDEDRLCKSKATFENNHILNVPVLEDNLARNNANAINFDFELTKDKILQNVPSKSGNVVHKDTCTALPTENNYNTNNVNYDRNNYYLDNDSITNGDLDLDENSFHVTEKTGKEIPMYKSKWDKIIERTSFDKINGKKQDKKSSVNAEDKSVEKRAISATENDGKTPLAVSKRKNCIDVSSFETNHALKTQYKTTETSNVIDIPVTELCNILETAKNLPLLTSYDDESLLKSKATFENNHILRLPVLEDKLAHNIVHANDFALTSDQFQNVAYKNSTLTVGDSCTAVSTESTYNSNTVKYDKNNDYLENESMTNGDLHLEENSSYCTEKAGKEIPMYERKCKKILERKSFDKINVKKQDTKFSENSKQKSTVKKTVSVTESDGKTPLAVSKRKDGTDDVASLLVPGKHVRNTKKKNNKSAEKDKLNRFYGNRVTNRGSFLTEPCSSNKKFKNKYNDVRLEDFHLMIKTPDINIDTNDRSSDKIPVSFGNRENNQFVDGFLENSVPSSTSRDICCSKEMNERTIVSNPYQSKIQTDERPLFSTLHLSAPHDPRNQSMLGRRSWLSSTSPSDTSTMSEEYSNIEKTILSTTSGSALIHDQCFLSAQPNLLTDRLNGESISRSISPQLSLPSSESQPAEDESFSGWPITDLITQPSTSSQFTSNAFKAILNPEKENILHDIISDLQDKTLSSEINKQTLCFSDRRAPTLGQSEQNSFACSSKVLFENEMEVSSSNDTYSLSSVDKSIVNFPSRGQFDFVKSTHSVSSPNNQLDPAFNSNISFSTQYIASDNSTDNTPLAPCPKKPICLVPQHLKTLVGHETIDTNDVLLLMLEWNEKWLLQQQKHPDPPPISNTLKNVSSTYDNFEDYYNTFFPLMLLETWHRMYMCWTRSNQSTSYSCQMISYCVESNHVIIECQTLYSTAAHLGGAFPDEGSILIVRYAEKSKYSLKVFGYVTNAKRRRFDSVTDSKLIYSLRPHKTAKSDFQVLTLTLMVAYCSEDIDKDSPIKILTICNVKHALRQNDALLFIHKSPLQRIILNPAAEEIFSHSLIPRNSPLEKVNECVHEITKGVLSPYSHPLLAVLRVKPESDRLNMIPLIINEMKTVYKTKVLLSVRTKRALCDIAANICLHESLKIIIINKRCDTYPQLRRYLLEEAATAEICKTSEDKVSEKTHSRSEIAAKAKKQVLKECDVVVSLIRNSHDEFLREAFEDCKSQMCCIIDEANLCTEPESFIPLLHGFSKCILIGDPQYPAKVSSKTAKHFGYIQSFFQRANDLSLNT